MPALRVEDAWPSIVDRENYEQAKAQLRARSLKITNPRRVTSSYLLSGLARCGSCGKALIGLQAKSGKFDYYVCGTLVKQVAGSCNARYLNTQKTEAVVSAWISQIELNSLNMRPSGMERTIKLHTEPVNGHAIRSIPPLSWRNHLLTSLKVRNPRPLPKRLPRGGLFVLNDPITLSPIPSLPEWTILAPAEAG